MQDQETDARSGAERQASHEVPRLGHAPGLDGLRGLAIVLVMLYHTPRTLWPEAAGWLLPGGSLGVHLFFVLSGFLITTLLLSEQARTGGIAIRSFAVRRVRRLGPVVASFVLALLVAGAVTARLGMRAAVLSSIQIVTSTTNVVASGVFRGSLAQDLLVVEDGLHLWSLAAEIHFYLLLAAGVWWVSRAGWSHTRLAIGIALAVVVVAVTRSVEEARGTSAIALYLSTWSRLDAPLVGALAAVAFVSGRLRNPPRWLAPAGVLGLVVLVTGAQVVDFSSPALPRGLYTMLALAAAATIATVVAEPAGALARVLAWRPLAWIGVISYSLFVWHFPIFMALGRRGFDIPGPARMLVAFALAFASAWLSYRLIERPFIRSGSRTPVRAPSRSTPRPELVTVIEPS